ncbi:hypothetical protein [Acuticoccus sediminis]|uniref:hypothetical protein n=1 Tax=Acuticoccus sediminis TaxID=2184697 RepID=UPI0011B94173|nr:hypothetical protein [Acuticoccus sediminis]
MRHRIVIGVAALLALCGAAAAQDFGDNSTSYLDGVVYDDDITPGRGPNADFYGTGSTAPTRTSDAYGTPGGTYTREYRENSPDLIGPDGRLRTN